MATLTKARAKSPLVKDASLHLRKAYNDTDWSAKTFSFDLLVSPPYDPENKARSYTVHMSAADAFRIAREIISELQVGMDLTRK